MFPISTEERIFIKSSAFDFCDSLSVCSANISEFSLFKDKIFGLFLTLFWITLLEKFVGSMEPFPPIEAKTGKKSLLCLGTYLLFVLDTLLGVEGFKFTSCDATEFLTFYSLLFLFSSRCFSSIIWSSLTSSVYFLGRKVVCCFFKFLLVLILIGLGCTNEILCPHFSYPSPSDWSIMFRIEFSLFSVSFFWEN